MGLLERAEHARRAAQAAYDVGYESGIHDHDAFATLGVVLRLREGAGLPRYPAALVPPLTRRVGPAAPPTSQPASYWRPEPVRW
ncbi:hypothetical protein OHS70_21565 [Streptomyces sp. NBC_00390]|uniref:hypothetical protein n=1 Tax=Streptomyces sp. NBC_00390 TaxID=2975736 RepID=UPI002E1E0420